MNIFAQVEDAKEKLLSVNEIVIEPKEDSYSIQVRFTPDGTLCLEELQQSFQLLEMAVFDDPGETQVEPNLESSLNSSQAEPNPNSSLEESGQNCAEEDASQFCSHKEASQKSSQHSSRRRIAQVRLQIGQIFRLVEVFKQLFASGCITYTFRGMRIGLEQVNRKGEEMQQLLDSWNAHWKQMEEMPHLALFSRGYLLSLADLIVKKKTNQVISVLRMLLPSASPKLDELVFQLISRELVIEDGESWLSVHQLFQILRELHEILQTVYHEDVNEQNIPAFITAYGRTLGFHFLDKPVQILNVQREILVGSALAASVAMTKKRIEPSRILFVTANTYPDEVDRFMTLWSISKAQDFFIMAHVERLSAAGACAIKEAVCRVPPESRCRLLLLAQHHDRVHVTKSLGARLGLASDRLLEVNFTSEQLRSCFFELLPSAANIHFYTSKLPGCGKSQRAMSLAAEPMANVVPKYHRIPVRMGSVEELLASLKNVEGVASKSEKPAVFLHLDVAHSASIEFNDILLSLLIHGALFDSRKAELGSWTLTNSVLIAIEFASPLGSKQFPIIGYLGQHTVCECTAETFTYKIATMPEVLD